MDKIKDMAGKAMGSSCSSNTNTGAANAGGQQDYVDKGMFFTPVLKISTNEEDGETQDHS